MLICEMMHYGQGGATGCTDQIMDLDDWLECALHDLC